MSAPTTSELLNETTPAATTGDQNVTFQSDGGTPLQQITAYPKRMTSSLHGTVGMGDLQQEAWLYGTDTGAANAYAVAYTPAPTLIAGSSGRFIAANANTGASTLAINGGSTIAIKKNGNTLALGAGDIQAGQLIEWIYDGTVIQILVAGTGSIYFGTSTVLASNGQDTITLGSTPIVGSWSVDINGVSIPFSLLSLSGAVITFDGTFTAGDTITCQWATLNTTPGAFTLSVSANYIRATAVFADNAGTTTVTMPIMAQPGDLAVLIVGGTAGTIPPPAGWTNVTETVGEDFFGGLLCSKILTLTDIAATLTFSAGTAAAQLVVFIGPTNGIREFHCTPWSNSSPLTVTMSSAVAASDTAIYFISQETTGSLASSRGTLEGNATGTGGSTADGSLWIEQLGSGGTYTDTLTFTDGRSWVGAVIVETILTSGGGVLPLVTPGQIVGTAAIQGSVQQQAYLYGTDTGAANAYAVTLSPAPTLVAGSKVVFIAANANTGASTLAINGGSTIAIKKNGNSTALASGDIAQYEIITATYDGTVFQIVVPGSGGGGSITLQTNGTNNGSQSKLNLVAGSSVTITDDGSGDVTIAASGGGGGSGALVLLEEHTASNSTALDFTSWYSSAYDDYIIRFVNLVPATNGATAQILCSTNGGSSYDTGANYGCIDYYFFSAASGLAGASFDTANAMSIIDSISSSANYGLCASLDFFSPGNTISYKQFIGRATWFHSSHALIFYSTTGGVYRNAAAVNALRVQFSNGNIASGTVRIYGLTH